MKRIILAVCLIALLPLPNYAASPQSFRSETVTFVKVCETATHYCSVDVVAQQDRVRAALLNALARMAKAADGSHFDRYIQLNPSVTLNFRIIREPRAIVA